MKKILLAVLLLVAGNGAYAQGAGLTINNMTDCTANILVYANSVTVSGSSSNCTYYVTGGSIPGGGYMAGATPYQWQTVYGFGGTNNNVCVGPCPSYASDFEWTFSNIDLSCPCGGDMASVNVGNTSTLCIGASSYTATTGCEGNTIDWTISLIAPYNVTINIHP